MSVKQVNVKYFALLREQAKKNEERIQSRAQSAEDLYKELSKSYGFSLRPEQVKVSINDSFESLDTELKDGDVIVFIPPVAGG